MILLLVFTTSAVFTNSLIKHCQSSKGPWKPTLSTVSLYRRGDQGSEKQHSGTEKSKDQRSAQLGSNARPASDLLVTLDLSLDLSVTWAKKQRALGTEGCSSAELCLREGLSPGRRELSLSNLHFQSLLLRVLKPRLLSWLPCVTMETVSPAQHPAVPHPSPFTLSLSCSSCGCSSPPGLINSRTFPRQELLSPFEIEENWDPEKGRDLPQGPAACYWQNHKHSFAPRGAPLPHHNRLSVWPYVLLIREVCFPFFLLSAFLVV